MSKLVLRIFSNRVIEWHSDCIPPGVLPRSIFRQLVLAALFQTHMLPGVSQTTPAVGEPSPPEASEISVASEKKKPNAVRKLTLWEALRLAEENNPRLRVAEAERQVAEASIITAKAYPNPTIGALAGPQYSMMSNAGRGPSGLLQGYNITQPIELPSLRRARREVAEKTLAGTDLGIQSARLQVRGIVKQTFYMVLRYEREVEVAEENLRLIEDLRRRIETQVSVGEAARLELVRAETEVATARTVLRSSQLNRMTALAVLRSAIGAAPDEELQPVGNLSAHLPLPDLETLREGMLQRHPALLQARANVATAESKVKMEMVSRKPQPSLYADYEHQPDLGFARVGIQIPLPIWNKREGPIAEAVAERNRLRAVHQVQETQLTAELERAYGQYQVATQQLESFQQGVLPEAEAALRAAEAAFRYGERGIIEVLDAQRVLRSVRFDYLNAQYDLQAALIDLEQLRAIDTVDHP